MSDLFTGSRRFGGGGGTAIYLFAAAGARRGSARRLAGMSRSGKSSGGLCVVAVRSYATPEVTFDGREFAEIYRADEADVRGKGRNGRKKRDLWHAPLKEALLGEVYRRKICSKLGWGRTSGGEGGWNGGVGLIDKGHTQYHRKTSWRRVHHNQKSSD